jgi:hypothetical protein
MAREEKVEPKSKEFPQLSAAMQGAILANMHSRYADELRTHGVDRPLAAAWRMSYEAYDKATGARICERASEEGDATGRRVQPLDLVERDGKLVEFWQVVRKTWQTS